MEEVLVAAEVNGLLRGLVWPSICHRCSPLIHSVHVYQSSDSIRDRRNSMKLQHAASVTCIL